MAQPAESKGGRLESLEAPVFISLVFGFLGWIQIRKCQNPFSFLNFLNFFNFFNLLPFRKIKRTEGILGLGQSGQASLAQTIEK